MLKNVASQIFTKKKIGAIIAAVALIGGVKTGYSLLYEVNGTVSKVDTKSIVVTSFLGTKTVNTGNYPIDSSKIVVGEKIEISKNLSGDVISIRTPDDKRLGGQLGRDGQFAQGLSGQRGFNGQSRHNGKARDDQAQISGVGENAQIQNGQGNPEMNNEQGLQNQQSQNGQGTQNGTPGQGSVDGVTSASVK